MFAMAKSNRLAADLQRTKRRRAEETEERAARLQSYIPQGAAIIKACATAATACVVCPFLPSPFVLRTYIYIYIYYIYIIYIYI